MAGAGQDRRRTSFTLVKDADAGLSPAPDPDTIVNGEYACHHVYADASYARARRAAEDYEYLKTLMSFGGGYGSAQEGSAQRMAHDMGEPARMQVLRILDAVEMWDPSR